MIPETAQPLGHPWTYLVASCLTAGAALAQPSTNVGPGEQRFNTGSYKASHNSYERDESYASQIDNWNCWCLELDIAWHPDNQVRVQHGCSVPNAGPLLLPHLQAIAQSIEAQDRVTVVYIEMKGGCFASWPARQVYRSYIRNAVDTAFGFRVYPASEFKQLDQFAWPSYQELLRRGYRWIVILDEEETGFADDDFFFGMARGNPPTAFEDNSVLVNSGNDDLPTDRGSQPDRWLFRAYPTPFCDIGDDEGYYDDAIANGYTFVATNCIDRHYTMTPTTHSPSPVRVTSGGGGTEFGTLSFPYRFGDGLLRAVDRASPRVPVNIVGGTYHVPPGTRLSRPVVLRAAGGPVQITSP
ncbi:MAG: hypothetical protein SFY69_05915 [Planctomycetota bacterium]|nr:hypothetical protein [Planctomycetota bacterium]